MNQQKHLQKSYNNPSTRAFKGKSWLQFEKPVLPVTVWTWGMLRIKWLLDVVDTRFHSVKRCDVVQKLLYVNNMRCLFLLDCVNQNSNFTSRMTKQRTETERSRRSKIFESSSTWVTTFISQSLFWQNRGIAVILFQSLTIDSLYIWVPSVWYHHFWISINTKSQKRCTNPFPLQLIFLIVVINTCPTSLIKICSSWVFIDYLRLNICLYIIIGKALTTPLSHEQ